MKKKKNLPETPEEILSYVTPHRMAAWKKKAEEGLATYFFIMSRRHRHIAWCSHCRRFDGDCVRVAIEGKTSARTAGVSVSRSTAGAATRTCMTG